jgi:FkbM family methyltransferase
MDWYVITETVVLNCYKYTPQENIIDIGAAIGDFTVLSALKSKHVYALEPEPSSFQLLESNISLNKLSNIICFPIALHSSKKYLELSVSNTNHHHTNDYSASNKIKVPSISLDKLLNQLDETKFYIKCDCEGGEYDIFNTLSASAYSKISQIVMEYHLFTSKHQKQFKILQKNLIKHQFKLSLSPNPVHSDIGFLSATKIKV